MALFKQIAEQIRRTLKWSLVFLFLVLANASFSQNNDSDILFEKARVEGGNNNFAKAATYCKMALMLAPLDMDIKEYLGKCYMELGRFEESRITLLEVLKKSPKRVEARHYLLNIEFQTERYSSAVCYANELLEITPYAKTLWIKKIQLYRLMKNEVEAHRATVRLFHIFPEDDEVRQLYNSLLKEEAIAAGKRQDHAKAIEQYEQALLTATNDAELFLNLVNAYIRIGNFDKALETANKGLYYLPTNKDIFDKKIGVLEKKQDYAQAIDAVQLRLKIAPSQEYTVLLNYLLSESARHQRNADPYELYGQLYARDKSNTEAYTYLLNTALSRGYFGAAQELIYEGLKGSPSSKELLSKLLYLYEMQQNKDGERSTVVKLHQLYPYDADVLEKYQKIQFSQAVEDMENKQYRSALPVFLSLKNHPDYGFSASKALISIYIAQNRFDKALDIVDELIAQTPDNHHLMIRKIDVYVHKGDYETAYDLLANFQNQYPDVQEYRDMADELAVDYVKQLREFEDFTKIKEVTDNMIFANPKNKLAYLYGIGARLERGEFLEAIDVTEIALIYFPNDKDFKMRLAGIYADANQTDDALRLLADLRKEYPYNSLFRDAYIEQLYKKGRELQRADNTSQAVQVYQEIISITPKDSLAPLKIANILISENQLDEAMQAVDTGLFYHPDNNDLIYKKAVVFELQNNFEKSLEYYKRYIPPYHLLDAHRDLLDYIESRTYKNQVNLSYLRVTTDSIFLQTSVATFDYTRVFKNNALTMRYNYAARTLGIGSQFELDWYRELKNKASYLANIGVSDRFFPAFKAGLSFYHPLKSDYTVETGARYLRFRPERNLYMGILGLEKTFNRTWVNLRGSVIYADQKFYNSILGQSRFYMKNERNYLLAQASIGTIPEVANLDFQLNSFLSFVNTMVGAGYFHHFNYSTSLGVMGNWYSFRLAPDRIVNLYHVFISVRHKF